MHNQANNTVRQIQLCQLDILKAVTAICEKYGVKYYLSSGTLLGAVRHQGFIPWDDDVDIEMPYPDYIRFLDVAQKELGDSFFVQNANTDENYSNLYTKVRRNNTIMRLADDYGLTGHYGVWIDIFPQIHLRGKMDLKIKRTVVSICNYLQMTDAVYAHVRTRILEKRKDCNPVFRDLIRKLPATIRSVFLHVLQQYLFCFPKSGALSAYVWGNISKTRPSALYGDGVKLIFEGESYTVPAQYDQYLQIEYGDYMKLPPEDKRGGHWPIEIKLDRVYSEPNAQ